MKIRIFIILVSFLLFFSSFVLAVGIGASPAILNFDVQRGDSVKSSFQVSTTSQEGLDLRVSISGEIKSLVKVSSSSVVAKLGSHTIIPVEVNIPRDYEPGNYTGYITVNTDSSGVTTGSGSKISTGVVVIVRISVLGDKAVKPINDKSENKEIENKEKSSSGKTNGLLFNLLLIIAVIVVVVWFINRKK